MREVVRNGLCSNVYTKSADLQWSTIETLEKCFGTCTHTTANERAIRVELGRSKEPGRESSRLDVFPETINNDRSHFSRVSNVIS